MTTSWARSGQRARQNGREVNPGTLTIGELSRRTGISASNLRMWESRYGFPLALRLPSGHRRYPEEVVDSILRVKQRREVGVRLEAAITEVSQFAASPATSVWAELRERHPHLRPHRLRKSTLLALSWALEDECCARASSPWLFGAFQREKYYRRAEGRWRDLARTSRGTWALADFADNVARSDAPVEVALPDGAPMHREWTLACLAEDFPAVLTAWEIPGQVGVVDRDRVFESVWSLEPEPVRDASRTLAHIVTDAGCDTRAVFHDLDRMRVPEPHHRDLRRATDLFNRVVAYVEKVR
jgi:MerR family transcriptional regulator, light-induced transcriptional regulator